jgi:hypothetical protein
LRLPTLARPASSESAITIIAEFNNTEKEAQDAASQQQQQQLSTATSAAPAAAADTSSDAAASNGGEDEMLAQYKPLAEREWLSEYDDDDSSFTTLAEAQAAAAKEAPADRAAAAASTFSSSSSSSSTYLPAGAPPQQQQQSGGSQGEKLQQYHALPSYATTAWGDEDGQYELATAMGSGSSTSSSRQDVASYAEEAANTYHVHESAAASLVGSSSTSSSSSSSSDHGQPDSHVYEAAPAAPAAVPAPTPATDFEDEFHHMYGPSEPSEPAINRPIWEDGDYAYSDRGFIEDPDYEEQQLSQQQETADAAPQQPLSPANKPTLFYQPLLDFDRPFSGDPDYDEQLYQQQENAQSLQQPIPADELMLSEAAGEVEQAKAAALQQQTLDESDLQYGGLQAALQQEQPAWLQAYNDAVQQRTAAQKYTAETVFEGFNDQSWQQQQQGNAYEYEYDDISAFDGSDAFWDESEDEVIQQAFSLPAELPVPQPQQYTSSSSSSSSSGRQLREGWRYHHVFKDQPGTLDNCPASWPVPNLWLKPGSSSSSSSSNDPVQVLPFTAEVSWPPCNAVVVSASLLRSVLQ